MSFLPDSEYVDRVIAAVNFGVRAEGKPLDMLLLHYTGMPSDDGALNWLCCEESQVSCHYFIYPDGEIIQLVPEKRRAWHAGRSYWAGETDINSRSIGIEIANAGHDGGLPDFPDEQIAAVIRLCRDIVTRRGISAERVLAHSDVAPDRKEDPGEKFPWDRLAEAGIGHWVLPEARQALADKPDTCLPFALQIGQEGPRVTELQWLLQNIGFNITVSGRFERETELALLAFQRHFRPECVDGRADAETMACLDAIRRAGASGQAAV